MTDATSATSATPTIVFVHGAWVSQPEAVTRLILSAVEATSRSRR